MRKMWRKQGLFMPPPARYFLITLAILAAAGMQPGAAEEISGTAAILDADTIRIQGTRIRLVGVDAPETDQICINRDGRRWLCGIAARDALSKLIANRPVRCLVSGQDIYGRKLAACMVGRENINRWLVREGYALAYVQYSREFVGEEKEARDSGRGLWVGAFVAPWDWRTRTPKTAMLGAKASGIAPSAVLAPTEAPPDPACAIKGNVNRKGEHIFHVPGQRDYERINMQAVAKRWFCSEEEAEAAGWRKAQR
jgi:endonuclease YncB( thermonuclease family)